MDESVATQSTEEKPQLRRRRALLLRIGLCLLSLTAALVVAEGLLRIIEWGNPDFNRFYFILADHGEKLLYDPDLGWRNAPDWSIEGPKTTITVNSRGLRGPERGYEKPDGTRRILVLGDSFTFGYDVNDDETYSVVLEEKLRENDADYEVLNTGVTGYGTDQQYLTLMKEGHRYSPDLVVLAFFTRNDFFEIQSAALSFNAKPFFADDSLRLANVPVPLFASAGPSQAYFQPAGLIRSSALYRLVFLNGVKSYYAASLLSLLGFCDLSESLQPTYNGNPVDLAVAILRKTADHLQQRDCPFVVMKFGDFLEESASELSAEFDRKLREDLRGIHYLDLDAAFQQRQLSKKLLTEGAGDYHWNAVGHRHVAAILQESLEQEGLISH